MSYQACDIDKLRDLVRRQHYAKNRRYHEHRASALSAEEVERQLTTYMGQGTTVIALTKCVEQIEAEAAKRVAEERIRDVERKNKQQAHDVLNKAIGLAKERRGTVTIRRPGSYSWELTEDFIAAAKAVKERIGDPWDDG